MKKKDEGRNENKEEENEEEQNSGSEFYLIPNNRCVFIALVYAIGKAAQ